MKTPIYINLRRLKSNVTLLFYKYFLLIIISAFCFLESNAQSNKEYVSSVFKVYGECMQCKQRIEKSLKVNGIQSANWDVKTKMLNVSYDSSVLNLADIQSKILAVGHDL